MKILFLSFLFFTHTLLAQTLDDTQLKKMIGKMLIVGFPLSQVDANSSIIKDINTYSLGGVILFDIFYTEQTRQKNIVSPEQVKALTSDLQNLSTHTILISVDQEGGRVARLKEKYGFQGFASATKVSELSLFEARKNYEAMSHMLQDNGFNCNFAPVVDLAINPKNKVIVGLERSFGKSHILASIYAKIQIDAQKNHNILSVLKHFPGHGSSLGDSHLGFVDITDTWSQKELKPYKNLIASDSVDMIMTAHVFNKHLDAQYPATLSHNVNTKLLRQEMGYKGVVVSDDLQMKAITEHYSLQETVSLAINAGVDILLFGNQLQHYTTSHIIDTILSEVKNKNIPLQRIIDSNTRIQKLYE